MKKAPSGPDAFQCFYESTAPAIRAYILSRCGDRSAADDLFQTTYIKFLASRMAETPLAPQARAYLYRIASNAIIDRGRRHQRRRKFESSFEDPPAKTCDLPVAEVAELRAALRDLSDRERQLLWLIYAEGFSHKEIAHIMNVSAASVRVVAFRARKKLAQRLVDDRATKHES